MVDFIDDTQADMEREQERAMKLNALAVAQIPAGEPGDCDRCGEFSLRLVRGYCAPCRDKYKLT